MVFRYCLSLVFKNVTVSLYWSRVPDLGNPSSLIVALAFILVAYSALSYLVVLKSSAITTLTTPNIFLLIFSMRAFVTNFTEPSSSYSIALILYLSASSNNFYFAASLCSSPTLSLSSFFAVLSALKGLNIFWPPYTVINLLVSTG